MHKARSSILQVLAGFFVFAVFEVLLLWAFHPQGPTIESWQVEGPGFRSQERAPFSIPFKERAQGIYRFTASFPRTSDDLLIVPRPIGNSLLAQVNGVTVGQVGSLRIPTGNTWNSTFAFPLPESCSRGVNHVTISVYGHHDAGLPFVPYTADSAQVGSKLDVQDFLTQSTTAIVFGMALVLMILLLLLAFRVSDRRGAYLCLVAACIFCIIFNLDTIERFQTFSESTFLVWRKVIISSLFIAAALLFSGVYLFYKKSKANYILALSPLLAVPFLLCARDFYSLQAIYSFTSPLIILIIPVIMVRERRLLDYPLIFSLTFLALCSVHGAFVLFGAITQPYIVSLGITVFLLGVAMVLIQRMVYLEWETKVLKEEAIRDPLTGLLSRKYLKTLTIHEQDALFFMDLDGFKEVNDREGHAEGDRLLVGVAEALIAETRGADDVLRYGGDEMIIVFRGITEADLASCVRRIERRLAALTPPVAFSYGVAAGQESLHDAINLADQRMYEMKRAKRGEA